MNKSQVDAAALAAAALGATVALTLLAGPFAWMASIVGLVLLIVLFGFDVEGYRTMTGSLAFAAIAGLCFTVGCGALLSTLAAHGEVHLADGAWQTTGLPGVFLFATVVLWAIDRSRMSGRVSASERVPTQAGGIQATNFLRQPAPAPAPVSYPAASYSQPAPPPPAYVPPPAYAPPPPVPTPAPPPAPVYAPPVAVAPEPAAVAPPRSPETPVAPPVASPLEQPAASASPVLSRGGKEVMIYVTLLGEGLNVMRSVRAEQLGRDYYLINDTMPPGETWQFQPGQVVRCKKQNLSTGRALVAIEEAPRA